MAITHTTHTTQQVEGVWSCSECDQTQTRGLDRRCPSCARAPYVSSDYQVGDTIEAQMCSGVWRTARIERVYEFGADVMFTSRGSQLFVSGAHYALFNDMRKARS